MAEPQMLTQDGLEKLQAKRDRLVAEKEEAVVRLQEARELGDLKENAEYDSAKAQVSLIQSELDEVNAILTNYKLIEVKDNKSVQLGSLVKLQDITFDEEVTFRIVAGHEATLEEGKINVACALAKAIIGHKKGDKVTYLGPTNQQIQVKILDITV